jgi:hypothetical protein
MPTDELKLPARQKQLYELLLGRGDVAVLELYQKMQGPAEHADDVRYAQQYLGGYITKLNRRIQARKIRVVPGRMKNTYTLSVQG